MTDARYLLRFDDLNPEMNHEVWAAVEHLLISAGVSPVLAVVPANEDPSLRISAPDDSFWDRVRGWQERGWTIGLHGFRHVYDRADRGLVGRRAQSEFAGWAEAEQARRLDAALAVFAEHGIRTRTWVAPGHTFDATTVRLLVERGVDVMVDGFHTVPFRDDDGALWVPQQLWRFRHRPRGVWTVCLHHNRWDARGLEVFRTALEAFAPRMATLDDVIRAYGDRRGRVTDRVASLAIRTELALHDRLASLRR